MMINFLAAARALSDRALLARLDVLASKEREATVELLAHLAALDSRPSLYTAQGFGSLFMYCTHALRLSEDAACARIKAARACRRFPQVLDLLASGATTLTSVRLLAPHLTPENHVAVLDRACGRSRREIEALVAELAPQPDVPPSVRKLPAPRPVTPSLPSPTTDAPGSQASTAEPPPPVFLAPARPIVQATAPERYRVQFTVGEQTHEKLRRLQTLLRREIPDGDPAAIFDRALSLLLERVEKTKLGARRRPSSSTRPRTGGSAPPLDPSSRSIPRAVKRAVSERDGSRCTFVSKDGRRCPERTFLEFHHIRPYAWKGPATVENICLRCRRHNQHDAELVFGPRKYGGRRERAEGAEVAFPPDAPRQAV